MASSSSASKVAKLAQKGKGKKVRFQGGTLFPLVIVVVVLVLGALIIYARQSRPGPGEGEPTANQHWHAAIDFYVCDDTGLRTYPKLSGTLEEQNADGSLVSRRYATTGIHSHGDGVMHWHPSASGKATGTNAKLKVFLDNYGVELTNSKLVFPASQGGETFEEGKTKCIVNGKEENAQLKLWVWDDYTKVSSEDPQVYTANMGDVRVKNDGMAFMIAFVPDDTPFKAPDSAFNLEALGAADGGGAVQTPTSDSSGSGEPSDTASTVAGTDTTLFGAATTTSTAGSTPISSGTPTDDSTATSDSVSAPATTDASSTATTGG